MSATRIPPEGYDRLRRDLFDAPEEAPPSPAPLDRIGKYVVRREVGRGAMGVVLEAEDTDLRRRVALKILREGDAPPELVARLHREAAIAAGLQHPHIVPVHEVGLARDSAGRPTHFIAMDFVQGTTLDAELARGRDRGELLAMLATVARAAHHAHGRGVIHRDLKPGNVLIAADGRPLLTDFGLAHGDSFGTRLTRTNAVLGTPQYMAPEQVEGRTAEIDARTDVYALGVILYEILARRRPFKGSTVAHVYHQILHVDPAPPGRVQAGVSRDLEIVCLKAMDRDPRRRYASAAAFADDLDRARVGDPISARPPSLRYRVGRTVRRHRVAFLGIAGVLVLAVAGAAAGGHLLRESERRADEERRATLDSLRRRAELLLAAALQARRAGDLAGLQRHEEELVESCRQVRERQPDATEPDVLLGRMARARQRNDEALRLQERALQRDPGNATARYERAILLAAEFRARLWSLQLDLDKDILRFLRIQGFERGGSQASSPSSLEDAARDAKASDLRRRLELDIAHLVKGESGALGPARRQVLLGLQAWTSGRAAEATELLALAARQQPDLDEAFEALVLLELDRGRYAEAAEWCTRALAVDKGYTTWRIWRAHALEYLAERSGWSSAEGDRASAAALEDLAALLPLDPRWELRFLKARITLVRVQVAAEKNRTAALATAATDLEDAVRRGAREMDVALLRGILQAILAGDISEAGRDPSDAYRAALARIAVVGTGPDRSASAWYIAGAIRNNWGIWCQRNGKPSKDQFQEAHLEFTRALEKDPRMNDARYGAGITASCLMLEAPDAAAMEPLYQAAKAHLERYLEGDPRSLKALHELAKTHANRGQLQQRTGADPDPYYARAEATFDRLLLVAPKALEYWIDRAVIRTNRGNHARRAGRDPEPFYQAAADDCTQAIQITSSNAEAWNRRGRVRYALFQVRSAAGRDASADMRAALGDWEEAIRLRPALEPELRPYMDTLRRLLGGE